MTPRSLLKIIAAVVCAAAPGIALAHLGNDAGLHHGSGFLAGLEHPFSGLDHLCAMVAVGIWSAMTTRRIWLVPAAFAAMLAVGALLGADGLTLPGVEPAIAASLLIIGLLVATRVHLPGPVCAMLIGAFAVFHGLAHGTELAGATVFAAALAGILVGTMLLHLSGIGIGLTLKSRNPLSARILGGGVAMFGAVLLAHLA
ncbi:MAG: urease accessory protein UreJ [Hydrogenophilaceae bacterium CG1_02_62_390]|nr:MAG: urease accessory protein UreJ [Hydrogenophilaceae bacterium CG1_02_62_390]